MKRQGTQPNELQSRSGIEGSAQHGEPLVPGRRFSRAVGKFAALFKEFVVERS